MNEDLARTLHPPRLPEDFAAPGIAEFLAAFGIGLLLAALILTFAMPFLRRRPPAKSLRVRIAETSALPEAERSLALLRLLAETGGTLPADLRQALYAREGAGTERIEALIGQPPGRDTGTRRAGRLS